MTNGSTFLGSVTFDSNQQRSFIYTFIGRQCNGSWTILKSITPTFTNLDTNICTYLNYPTMDNAVGEETGRKETIISDDE